MDIYSSPIIGAAEDLIISLFEFVKNLKENVVILLDDVEYLLGSSYGVHKKEEEEEESSLQVRIKHAFCTAFDSLIHDVSRGNNNNNNNNILLIGTSKSRGNEITHRFDKVIHMSYFLSEVECRSVLSSCLILPQDDDTPKNMFQKTTTEMIQESQKIEELVSTIVKCTTGKSTAEFARSCRDALVSFELSFQKKEKENNNNHQSSYETRLQLVKQSVQTTVPTSIKNGSLDGVLDVTIYTSKELLTELHFVDGDPILPLFGMEAKEAWEALETLIVTPLCQSSELDDILFGGGDDNGILSSSSSGGGRQQGGGGKMVCAGTLLTGPPGSGKTILAKHCAAVASTILPSLRLLDVSCTSLIHKEVGGSERAVQKLFAAAKAAAPCIILLDGIEHIAPVRGHDNTTEGTMDRLLSTVLMEMDGLDVRPSSSSDSGEDGKIAVIGITHNPKWIDPALRRPGRLEKCIVLHRPDVSTRKSILLQEIQKLPIDFSSSSGFFEPKDKKALAEFVALQTHGFSASEVIAVCTEACMICIRDIASLKNMEEEEGRHGDGGGGGKAIVEPILSHRHFASALHFRKTGTFK